MERKPLSKSGKLVLVVLAVFLLTSVVITLGSLLVNPEAPRPSAIVALPTPTESVQPRNQTKDAQTLLEQQQVINARKTPEPSLTDVARKQPRQPLAAAIETGTFKPIPGSAPAGSGAIVQVSPPFSNNQYHIENTWYADSDNASRRTFVFAGNVAGPGGQTSDQGVAIVQNLQYGVVDGAWVVQTLETHAYTSTVSTGSLHITGADANRLILQTSAGVTTYFNLSTRTFVLP